MTIKPYLTRIAMNATLALRHPAARLMAFLYMLSAVVFFLATGDGYTLLLQLGLTFWTLLTALIAVSLTTQPPVAWAADRPRLGWQLGAIILVIVYTLFRNSPQLYGLPILGDMARAISALHYSLSNPLLYVVIPLILLFLLGARPAELGLSLPRTRSDWARTGILILVMTSANLAYIIPALTFGIFSLPTFGQRLFSHLLQNGFSEEFLMRGALMTRLNLLTNSGWGMVLSSLIFGLWHLETNLSMFNHNILAALAFSIISQGLAGLGFAIAMQRSGHLVAPSINHILSHFFPF